MCFNLNRYYKSKRNIFFLLVIIGLVSGCEKDRNDNPVESRLGTFIGEEKVTRVPVGMEDTIISVEQATYDLYFSEESFYLTTTGWYNPIEIPPSEFKDGIYYESGYDVDYYSLSIKVVNDTLRYKYESYSSATFEDILVEFVGIKN